MGKVVIEKFVVEKHFVSYAKFARQMFGENSYQTNRCYFDWLKCNTNHSFVALEADRGEVVGFASGINVQWIIDGNVESFVVPHNLMLLPDFRYGVGVGLFFKIFKVSRYLFVPGTTSKMKDFYGKLGATLVCPSQYRKILHPVFGGLKILGSKLFRVSSAPAYFSLHVDKEFNYHGKAHIDFSPDDNLISKLTQLWNNYARGFIAPYADSKFFIWRFFYQQGPEHLLVYLGTKNNPTDFMILSLGPRKGLNVARIVITAVNSADALWQLLLCVEQVSKDCAADILLSVQVDPYLDGLYTAIGWKRAKSYVDMHVCLAGKRVNSDLLKIHGFAGDYGFEAIR